MKGIENKLLVLKLNSAWQAVGQSIVADALIDLCAGKNSFALDIQYEIDESGNPDTTKASSIRPVSWDEWIALPVRSWDFSIRSPKMEIRVPTVLVAKNFSKMPKKVFKGAPSKDALGIRDNWTDAYTGKKLTRDQATIDHVIPKSRGGKDEWTNEVLTTKEINSMKGDKLNHEVGLKLVKQPREPLPVPLSALIRDIHHVDWIHFLQK